MHVSDFSFLVGSDSPSSFWATLQKIQSYLNLSDAETACAMGITVRELQTLRAKSKDPSVSSGMKLAERLNISFDSFFSGKIDFTALLNQHHGRHFELPERYTRNALGKCRTITPIFQFIERRFGFSHRSLIMRKFQVQEAMFLDPDRPINALFGMDLLKYIQEYYQNTSMLESIGQFSAWTNRESLACEDEESTQHFSEVFERVFEKIAPQKIERNYHWKVLRASGTTCVVEGIPSSELKFFDRLGLRQQLEPCLLRKGFLSMIPRFASYPAALVKKIACVSQGDQSCQYEVALLEQ